MYRPAIVAVGYDRPEALKRLLTSIESAVYAEDVRPVLVISIDKSGNDDVVNVARKFEYSHGDKVVIERPERMGLREHVLTCGDLTEEYGSIIVLEDDIFVAPCFYEYACNALDISDEDDRIGAISLYNHLFNVHKRDSFCAIDDGYDNYYLQLASSWGQAYTKKQWSGFRKWYEANKERDLKDPFVPANVSGWSDRSWLKYYIVYLIETGRYCLYPRVSFTTNFGDVGSHAVKPETDLQVPICGSRRHPYCNFSLTGSSRAVYDSFFEPVGITEDEKVCLGALDRINDDNTLLVDLYDTKPVKEMIASKRYRYVLSSKSLPYRVVRSFARQMRPVDANVVYEISGNDFHLYDVSKKADMPAKERDAHRYLYEYRGISAVRMIEIIKYRVLEKLGRN